MPGCRAVKAYGCQADNMCMNTDRAVRQPLLGQAHCQRCQRYLLAQSCEQQLNQLWRLLELEEIRDIANRGNVNDQARATEDS